MKLINSDKENRWIIVDLVSDYDAEILTACGFKYAYVVDENGHNGEDGKDYPYEIWHNINK